MTEPRKVNEMMGAILAMFPRCIHCGQPCTDPESTVIVSKRPNRLAHDKCQQAAA